MFRVSTHSWRVLLERTEWKRRLPSKRKADTAGAPGLPAFPWCDQLLPGRCLRTRQHRYDVTPTRYVERIQVIQHARDLFLQGSHLSLWRGPWNPFDCRAV